MMPFMTFIGNLGYVAVCVVGAALAMDGRIEFGVIVAFMMYIRLFTQPLAQFAQAMQNLQRCGAASERVFGFLEEPEMSVDATGSFAEQLMNGVSMMVILRSCSEGSVRVLMIAGTVQPKPTSMGTKLRPERPKRRSTLSITNATRAI